MNKVSTGLLILGFCFVSTYGQAATPRHVEGQIMIRSQFISVDPGVRGRLGGRSTYAQPLALGETIQSANVGVIEDSKHPKFAAGDWVAAAYGWQEAAVSDGRGVRKITETRLPPSTAIGVLGIPGLTAYFGLLDIGQPKAGETVVVSSAAGTVVGDITIAANMRVIEATEVVNGDVTSEVLPAPENGTTPGPDVIVGDLSGLAQFGSSSGTQVGLAVGTDAPKAK